jgi:hypothetical protein
MRALIVGLLSVTGIAACGPDPSAPTVAQTCTDDYMTIDTFQGTLREVAVAPEPFSSADLILDGPKDCSPLLMQVLKSDAAQCRIGDRIEARGIIVSDPENSEWNINPERNTYMMLGQDWTCTR